MSNLLEGASIDDVAFLGRGELIDMLTDFYFFYTPEGIEPFSTEQLRTLLLLALQRGQPY